MTKIQHWVVLFTVETWEEFLVSGGCIYSFPETGWNIAERVRVADRLLCYLTGASRFVGMLQVVTPAAKVNTRAGIRHQLPCRFGVKPVLTLTPLTAVPIDDLKAKLSIFKSAKGPRSWIWHVRRTPTLWESSDAKVVVGALELAAKSPTTQALDPVKIWRAGYEHARRFGGKIPERRSPSRS